MLVERPAAGRLGCLLAERAAALRVGDGLEPGVTVGPLIDGAALARERDHVSDAVERRARLLCGGGGPPGRDPERFFAPTVLADVPPDARVVTEETFGPVAPLISFDSEQDAVALANASRLRARGVPVHARPGRAHRVGEALDYGMVAVNDGALGWVQAPFSGIKGSGDGREGGRQGSRSTSTCST